MNKDLRTRASCLGLLVVALALTSASKSAFAASKTNWSKRLDLKAQTSAESPMTFKEYPKASADWPGDATLEPERVAPHAQVWIYKNQDTFTLDISLDSRAVLTQQMILPLDKNGKAIKGREDIGPPWIRVRTDEQPLKTLDALCVDKRKTCEAQWRKFPYDPTKEISLEFTTNIRGFENQTWKININRYIPRAYTPAAKEKIKVIDKWSGVHDTTFLKPKLQGVERELIFRAQELDGIDTDKNVTLTEEYTLGKNSKLSGVGFFRTDKAQRLRIMEGKVLVLIMIDTTLQTYEMEQGQELLLPAGSKVSFQSKITKGFPKTRLRRYVFD